MAKNSTRAKLTELPRNDGGTQCRQFGGVYRPPCNLLDFKVNPNLDGFPIRGAKGAEICAPFGRRRFALTPKLGRGPYKNFEVFCSGLVALLIHFPPSSPANSASRSSTATWIYVLPVVAHSLTVMGRSFPFGVRQIIMRGRRRISITCCSSSSIDTLLPPIVVDKCQVLAGWPFFLFVFSRTFPPFRTQVSPSSSSFLWPQKSRVSTLTNPNFLRPLKLPVCALFLCAHFCAF